MHHHHRLSQLGKMIKLVPIRLKIRLQLFISILLFTVELLLKLYYNVIDFLLDLEFQSVEVVLDRLEVLRLLFLPIE